MLCGLCGGGWSDIRVSMKSVNVYDFDGTIYDGDSSVDFFKFAVKKNPKILLRGFRILYFGAGYKFGKKTKEEFKSAFFSFVEDFDDMDGLVREFWKSHKKKIKSFYKKQRRDDDVIISASPEFLLRPVAEEMGFMLIATDVDEKSGKLVSKNCYGEEKVRRFRKLGFEINEFYSDSLADTPLAKLANEAFLVKGEKITTWSEK